MATQLSGGPIEITGIEIHELNEAFRRIQQELDELRGLRGSIVLQADITGATITTPTIADFTSAQHDHQDAAGGGQIDHGAANTGLTDNDHTQYLLRNGGNQVIGTLDFTAITAGSANLNINLTSDTPGTTWTTPPPGTGYEISAAPLGFLEVIIGGATAGYIPVYA